MMPTALAAADGPAVENPTITVRDVDGAERESSFGNASEHVLRTAQPWRTFRWYYGQRHYSGTYATATMSQSVIYESRLELARLLLADFDPDVTHIVSQPFLMRAIVDGKTRRDVVHLGHAAHVRLVWNILRCRLHRRCRAAVEAALRRKDRASANHRPRACAQSGSFSTCSADPEDQRRAGAGHGSEWSPVYGTRL